MASRLFAFLAAIALAGAARAEHPGMATPWQLGLQAPATPVMEQLFDLHHGLLILIIVICIFVLALLAYVCVRFSASRNKVPSKVTHNSLIEFIWTAVPILILGVIFFPSLRIHYFMDRAQDAEMTVKVTGFQWYWGYEYPDSGAISFESRLIPDPTKRLSRAEEDAILQGQPRLLTVDNPMVVPVGTNIRILTTAQDVIHSWAVPAFGVKLDAIPGRVNETWFRAEQTGTFRGQCSQLCGVWHGFMPVVVQVVSKEEFAAWVESKKQGASNSNAPLTLAQVK